MKYTLIILFLLLPVISNAQGFSFAIGGGGNLGTQPEYLWNYELAPTSHIESVTPMRIGSGFNLSAAGSYMIDIIGFGIGVDYFQGQTISLQFDDEINGLIKEDYTRKINNLIRIYPELILRTKGENLSAYLRMGATFSFGKLTQEYNRTPYPNSTNTIYQDIWEYKAENLIGFRNALGLNFSKKNIDLYLELVVLASNFSPSSATNTLSELDGIDVLPNRTIREKSVEFVSQIDRNTTLSDDVPNQLLKESYSNNSLGLNLGIRINLFDRNYF